MSKTVQLKLRECWREKVKTPEHTYLKDGLPSGWVFSIFEPEYPKYVAVPMESGKTGLFKLLEIETPSDPGDMHIARWGFIKYLKEEYNA